MKSYIPRSSSTIQSVAVSFRQGEIFDRQFIVNKSDRYIVELFVQLEDDFEKSICALTGYSDFTKVCSENLENFDLNIDVYQGNSVIDSRSVRGPDRPSLIGDGKVYRILGRFDLEPNTEYILKIKSLKDYSVINKFDPRINVTTVNFRNDTYYRKLIYRTCGALLLLVGFFVLLRYVFKFKFDRNQF